MNRVAELDGLRAIAALSVFAGHFAWPPIAALGAYGDAGVVVFFVLSGFLITNILLEQRDAPNFTLRAALNTFYLRRAFRIFPLYYAAIFLLLAFDQRHVTKQFYRLATFNLPGIQVVNTGDFGPLGHFWSLFVEEQFYLLWPLLLFTAPRRAFPWLLGAVIVASLAFKYGAAIVGLSYQSVFSRMCSSADHLGLGAGLACAIRANQQRVIRLFCGRVWLWMVPVAAMTLLRLGLGYDAWYRNHLAFGCLMLSAWALLTASIVVTAVRSPGLVKWLRWTPLVYLGTISYGFYVYHFMIPFLQGALLLGHFESGLFEFFYKLALTVGIAALSWRYLERPFLKLKDRFAVRSVATA